jgi:hypothetical protein
MSAFPDEAFLALVPTPAVAAELGEADNLVLIRPKIVSPRWAWLLRMMKKPAYRVRLDARGSAVWRACDGIRTVAQVVAVMETAQPGEADTQVRTAQFLLGLARGKFLRLS